MNYSNYLNRDYKKHDARASKTVPRLQRKHLHLLAISSVVVGFAALLSPTHEAEATRQIAESDTPSASQSLHEEILDLPLPPPEHQSAQHIVNSQLEEDLPWQAVTIHSGDNLSRIFDKLELSPQQLLAVVKADKGKQLVTALRPDKQLQFQIRDHQLQAIKYTLSPEKTLMVTRQGEGFNSHLIEHPVEIRLTHAAGEIETSLYQSGHDAGLSDNIVMEMANIFGWDVDFALDIRKGDKFSLLYEQQYLDGEKLRDGKILAAEFTNRGKNYRAVLYTDPNGDSEYFSPDGRSMRKAFLRSPVDFRRISSRFTTARYHPVLGRKRPHQGVDYAAATGTPIKASGDGKVIFRGRKGGYGNTVILRHGNHITTLYAHMSKYRRGVSSGSRVKQGQIIGYVGASGLATGPHLHYEFRISGVHRNPLTVKLPDAQPIATKYKADFMQQSRQLLSQLDVFKRTQLADASTR